MWMMWKVKRKEIRSTRNFEKAMMEDREKK
jgi:hypothetical protein